MTVAFSSGWNPQPDVAVYDTLPPRHPRERRFSDAALVVEVADSTLAYDLGDKAARYAAEGVQELWVADVDGRRLHVLRDPDGSDYKSQTLHKLGDTASPLCMPEVHIKVDDVIPAYPDEDAR